jgi:hypothetical protein
MKLNIYICGGAIVVCVVLNNYCNSENYCHNPYDESYIRKPVQIYNQEFQSLTYENNATTASGIINKNVNDFSYSNDEIFINKT